MLAKQRLCSVLIGITCLPALAAAQSQGQNQGQPMAGTPTPQVGEVTPAMHMGGDHATPASPVATGPLKISFGDKSAEWTLEKLAALPHKALTLFNEHAKANQNFSGVELMDLLALLGVSLKPHGKDLRLYVVAEGSDGYQVVYSIGEITPDLHDGTVLVADQLDGKPIGASGPLQLVSTGEKRPARWVRNLVAIKVRSVE